MQGSTKQILTAFSAIFDFFSRLQCQNTKHFVHQRLEFQFQKRQQRHHFWNFPKQQDREAKINGKNFSKDSFFRKLKVLVYESSIGGTHQSGCYIKTCKCISSWFFLSAHFGVLEAAGSWCRDQTKRFRKRMLMEKRKFLFRDFDMKPRIRDYWQNWLWTTMQIKEFILLCKVWTSKFLISSWTETILFEIPSMLLKTKAFSINS